MNSLPKEHAILRVRNPAITVFRATLWLLPAPFMVISFFAIQQFSPIPLSLFNPILFWLLLCAAFTAAGWFNAWLAPGACLKPVRVRKQTVKFFLFQMFFIPGILIAAVVMFVAFHPIHLRC